MLMSFINFCGTLRGPQFKKTIFFTVGFVFLFGWVTEAQSQAPANDNCANASALTVDGGCQNGTTGGGTVEPTENTSCFSSGAGCNLTQTTWHSFTTGSNTSLWLDLEQTNNSNCIGGFAVYGPNPTCFPGGGSQIVCENTLPGLGGTLLTGLSPNSTYYIQVGGRNGGGSGDRFLNYCIGIESPTACNNCSNPCGPACGFPSAPTVAQVTSTCPRYDLSPHVDSGNNTYCYTFNASSSSVDFQIIISGLGCTSGNIVNMNWSVFDQGACGSPLFTDVFPNLTMSGLTIGNNYTFCYTMEPACTHIAHYPFFIGASPLPISLLSFTGESKKTCNQINWASLTDSDADFQIERSLDGQHFTYIGSVAKDAVTQKHVEQSGPGSQTMLLSDGKNGSPLTKARAYTYRDFTFTPGVSYYRLRQFQLNGTDDFSPIIEIHRESDKISIEGPWPNPANSQTELQIAVPDPSSALIRTVSPSGKIIHSETASLISGANVVKLDTKSLPPGMYFIQIEAGGENSTLKMIKL